MLPLFSRYLILPASSDYSALTPTTRLSKKSFLTNLIEALENEDLSTESPSELAALVHSGALNFDFSVKYSDLPETLKIYPNFPNSKYYPNGIDVDCLTWKSYRDEGKKISLLTLVCLINNTASLNYILSSETQSLLLDSDDDNNQEKLKRSLKDKDDIAPPIFAALLRNNPKAVDLLVSALGPQILINDTFNGKNVLDFCVTKKTSKENSQSQKLLECVLTHLYKIEDTDTLIESTYTYTQAYYDRTNDFWTYNKKEYTIANIEIPGTGKTLREFNADFRENRSINILSCNKLMKNFI